jgi:transcriptional regulator with XRE-family HTH domain
MVTLPTMTVAQRVADARDERGMSNESLARAAELSVKTVSRIVNGEVADPREDTLRRLAKALGITADELRGRRPTPLGLAAGEDQVAAGFAEIRAEIATVKLDIETQNALLAEQSELLRELREVVAALPALRDATTQIERLRREAGELPPVEQVPFEPAVDPPAAEGHSRETG